MANDEPNYQSDAWIPETPGDVLEGTVRAVEYGWSDFKNAEYPILRIELADGEIKVFHAFRTVAQRQVLAKRPVTGERIKVTYLGARPPKPGETQNPPVGYRLEMPDRGPEDDQATYDRLDISDPHRPRTGAPAAQAELPIDTEGLPEAV